MREDQTPRCDTGCGRPSPYGYVCYPCIDEAREQLEAITPEQLNEILLIARGEAQPANMNVIGNSTNKSPRDVLNVAVFALLGDLMHRWPSMLNTLHRHHRAKYELWNLQRGIREVERLTIPEDEGTHEDGYLEDKMKQIRIMRPVELVPWMREHLSIRITRSQIDDWRYLGLLAPRRKYAGAVWYHPADVLHAMDARQWQPAVTRA